jgi:hypothetical protein
MCCWVQVVPETAQRECMDVHLCTCCNVGDLYCSMPLLPRENRTLVMDCSCPSDLFDSTAQCSHNPLKYHKLLENLQQWKTKQPYGGMIPTFPSAL